MLRDWQTKLQEIVKKFAADVGMLHSLDLKENCLYLLAYTNNLPEQLVKATQRIPLKKGTIAAVTVSEKRPIIMTELVTDPSPMIVPMERDLGVKGIMSVPIFDGEEVVGNLGIGCFDKRLFTEQEAFALIEEGRSIAKLLMEEEQE